MLILNAMAYILLSYNPRKHKAGGTKKWHL